jgi:hypothetical protein
MMLADKKNGGAPLLEPFEKWASGQPALQWFPSYYVYDLVGKMQPVTES